MHLGKTKILTTNANQRTEALPIGGALADVLKSSASERYLGRKLCMGDYHDAELSNRTRSAWGAFAKLRHVLCSRRYPLKARQKLFDIAVTPSALYACSSWTMTAERKRKLKTVWRQMMRKAIQVPCCTDESWVEHIQRATHLAENRCRSLGFLAWDTLQAKIKQQFAAKIANGSAEKWTARLLHWEPWFRIDAWRRIGRSSIRWSDAVIARRIRQWLCKCSLSGHCPS